MLSSWVGWRGAEGERHIIDFLVFYSFAFDLKPKDLFVASVVD